MSQSEPGAGLAQLHAERERLISHFSERFSVGVIEVEEFERRLDELHRSTSLVELQRQAPGLLVSPGAESLAIRPAAALIPAEQAPSQKQVLAVFGSTERRGTWTGPRRLKVSAVFGNVTLDFRDARLPAGTVDIEVNAAFGNVEILVPPSLAVETEGAASPMRRYCTSRASPCSATSKSARASRRTSKINSRCDGVEFRSFTQARILV